MKHREGNRQSEPSMSLYLFYLDDIKHALLNEILTERTYIQLQSHKEPYRATGGT